jgi:hypothetical protein
MSFYSLTAQFIFLWALMCQSRCWIWCGVGFFASAFFANRLNFVLHNFFKIPYHIVFYKKSKNPKNYFRNIYLKKPYHLILFLAPARVHKYYHILLVCYRKSWEFEKFIVNFTVDPSPLINFNG